MKFSSKKGFTLLELIVVITILGVLAAAISGQFVSSLKKGRDARRKADLEQISRALETYYEDNKAYPTTLTTGSTLCHPSGCSTRTYMQRVPADSTSPNYSYTSAGPTYTLYACLENDQQIITNVSVNAGAYGCTRTCKNSAGATINCVYGISDSNSLP